MLAQFFDNLVIWIQHYGPITLFALLALGILLLPVPDESLMVTAGALIRKGDLQPFATVLACILGAWCGITSSYLIGAYLGTYLVTTRFGHWLHLESRLVKAQKWFERFGKWSLLIGYFIPGVRHFTGYTAGLLALPYRQFSLFAYTGGFLWATLFLALGYGILPYLASFWSIVAPLPEQVFGYF